MLRSKYGKGMVAEDKRILDQLLEQSVSEVGAVYGDVLDTVCNLIISGDCSDALKYNAMCKTSWFRKYVQTFVDVKGGK